MPDFAKVMAVALLMLAGLLVIASSPSFHVYTGVPGTYRKITVYRGGGEAGTPPEGEPLRFFINTSVKKLVLPRQESLIRHLYLADSLRVQFSTSSTILLSENNITVANGVFEKRFYVKEFSVPSLLSLERAKLKIKILDTNLYGKLRIFLNDNEIFSGVAKKGKRIEIPLNLSTLKEENVLLIGCDSSSWRLWAPTVYILSLNLSAKYLSTHSQTLVFDVPNATSLSEMRILWYARRLEGNSSLRAFFNGKELYSGSDYAPLLDVSPEKFEIRETGNELKFETGRNTAYTIEDVEAILFYRIKASAEVFVEITRKDMEKLEHKNVSLAFDLAKITGDVSGMRITIVDAEGNVHLIVPQILREGEYRIPLKGKELKIGKNIIKFELLGSGRIEIENIRIEVG